MRSKFVFPALLIPVLASCQAPVSKPQDFRVLNLNSPRPNVIAQLGEPVASTKNGDLTTTDSMRVSHGSHAAANAAGGFSRWVFGVSTLGISQAVVPSRQDDPVSFTVDYNGDNCIKRVTPMNKRARKVFKSQGINSVMANDAG